MNTANERLFRQGFDAQGRGMDITKAAQVARKGELDITAKEADIKTTAAQDATIQRSIQWHDARAINDTGTMLKLESEGSIYNWDQLNRAKAGEDIYKDPTSRLLQLPGGDLFEHTKGTPIPAGTTTPTERVEDVGAKARTTASVRNEAYFDSVNFIRDVEGDLRKRDPLGGIDITQEDIAQEAAARMRFSGIAKFQGAKVAKMNESGAIVIIDENNVILKVF